MDLSRSRVPLGPGASMVSRRFNCRFFLGPDSPPSPSSNWSGVKVRPFVDALISLGTPHLSFVCSKSPVRGSSEDAILGEQLIQTEVQGRAQLVLLLLRRRLGSPGTGGGREVGPVQPRQVGKALLELVEEQGSAGMEKAEGESVVEWMEGDGRHRPRLQTTQATRESSVLRLPEQHLRVKIIIAGASDRTGSSALLQPRRRSRAGRRSHTATSPADPSDRDLAVPPVDFEGRLWDQRVSLALAQVSLAQCN